MSAPGTLRGAAALLALAAALWSPPPARAGEVDDPPRRFAAGLELRGLLLARPGEAFREESPPAIGAAVFARAGWVHLGLAADVQAAYQTFGWRPPDETLIVRRHRTFSLEAGASLPGTLAGERWFWRHVRLDVLAMLGVERTRVHEDLGGGGVGARTWHRSSPFLGLRVGPQLRVGRAFGGYFGVAGWFRHPLRRGSVPSATGRSEPATGDSLGVMLFGGGDAEWD